MKLVLTPWKKSYVFKIIMYYSQLYLAQIYLKNVLQVNRIPMFSCTFKKLNRLHLPKLTLKSSSQKQHEWMKSFSA